MTNLEVCLNCLIEVQFNVLGVPLMPVKKLLKYRLNLNRLEDRNVICHCHGDHDAVCILHEGSCHPSDMKWCWLSR